MWKTIATSALTFCASAIFFTTDHVRNEVTRDELQGDIITLQQPEYLSLTNHIADDRIKFDSVLAVEKEGEELMREVLKEVRKRPRLSTMIENRGQTINK